MVQQCCVRLHSTSNNVNVAPVHAHFMPRIHTNTCEQKIKMASEVENVPESFVFSSKDPTCCDLLRAFAHIAQQETILLGPTMLRVVASVCTGLYNPYALVVKLSIINCMNLLSTPERRFWSYCSSEWRFIHRMVLSTL